MADKKNFHGWVGRTPIEKLEVKICDKIEELNSFFESDSQKVCTKANLLPLQKLIEKFLKLEKQK